MTDPDYPYSPYEPQSSTDKPETYSTGFQQRVREILTNFHGWCVEDAEGLHSDEPDFDYDQAIAAIRQAVVDSNPPLLTPPGMNQDYRNGWNAHHDAVIEAIGAEHD